MRVQVLIKKKEVRQQQDLMMPSLEQLTQNIESQALSKNYENDLNKLGEKFFTLLSLTSKEPEFYKFINSFNERDKFFYRKMIRQDKIGDG